DAVEYAINLRCAECVAALVPSLTERWKDLALRHAVLRGFAEAVEELLKAGANPDQQDDDGSLLHEAAARRDARIMRALLSRGARPDVYNKEGLTPLDAAAKSGCLDCVEELLRRGARPTARSLRLAISASDSYEERRQIVLLLLRYVEGPALKKRAKCRLFREAVKRGDAELVEALIRAGLKPARCGCIAGKAGNAETFRLLASAASPICIRYRDVTSADVLREAVKIFGPRHADREGGTALHAAARLCDVELIQQLLDGGANIDARDKHGRTPLYYAVESRCLDAVLLLLQRGALPSSSDLEPAVRRNDVALLSVLLKANPEAARGAGPLHVAAAANAVESAALLIAYGADINARGRNNKTPLHVAMLHCNTEIVELLLRYGASIKARDRFDRTPVQAARRCPGILEALLERCWSRIQQSS
ncbi:MAG: ankyrin repeat domain-containing protein, partial [Thermoproteus sp.]